MKGNIDNFGKNAGKIWRALEKYGPLNETDLIKKIRLNKNDFYAGLGWLARENKICKFGVKYQLGDTNLTTDIGSNAGKVWHTLNTLQDINISTIAENSQITIKDAYSALGWLARENKIQTSKGKKLRYKLK
ncbi:MAG: winged helix-turn-helix domain-containing protein [Candidatus Hodarchaeota archaeon]